MTARQRDKEIDHWQSVIEKLEQPNKWVRIDNWSHSYKDIRQEIYYAESRINQIREEWRLSRIKEMKKSEGLLNSDSL